MLHSWSLLALAIAPTLAFNADNTCGSNGNGASCDPRAPNAANPQGGGCCSSAGFCGSSSAYCGTGCQSAYGLCFGTSPPATKTGTNAYAVARVGTFTTFKNYTFAGTTLTSELLKSDYPVDDTPAPYNHSFVPANVAVSGGYLRISVPGGQKTSPIKCGEVTTLESKIKYASVRTYARFSSAPGTVQGQFFYRNDRQEMDIEYLSDPNSQSNPGPNKAPNLQYTNQANDGNTSHATYSPGPAPTTPYTQIHEYRIDWVPGKSTYFLDGVLQKTFTTNVPTVAGSWIWNDWSNGDPGFTVGPPAQTNTFLIKNIVMYYNTTA